MEQADNEKSKRNVKKHAKRDRKFFFFWPCYFTLTKNESKSRTRVFNNETENYVYGCVYG